MSNSDKTTPSLTIDRAAFLLLRVKKAFRKKKQQRKDKGGPSPECNKQDNKTVPRGAGTRPAPLLRSRTLPAIVAPGLNILQVQLDAHYSRLESGDMGIGSRGSNEPNFGKRDSSVSYCGKFLAPRISFTDDTLGERRVSDTGPNYRENLLKEGSARSTGKLNSHSFASSQPLTKLARLLNQRPSFTPASDDIPRRLSWERKDRASSSSSNNNNSNSSSSCLPRSSSIDSVAEWKSIARADDKTATNGHLLAAYGFNAAPTGGAIDRSTLAEQQSIQKRSSSPLLGSRSDRLALVSPNIGRKLKGQRTVLGRTEGNHGKKINCDSTGDEENVRNMSRLRLSNDFGQGNSNKYSVNHEYRTLEEEKESNEHGDELKSYENPAFTDSSFDSTIDGFYHANDLAYSEKYSDYEVIQKTAQKASKSNDDRSGAVSVIVKNEPVCKIHEWCTRVKMHSAKQFFQSAKRHESKVKASGSEEAIVTTRPKDGNGKIQQRRRQSIEDVQVKNSSCQVLQENTINAKLQSSQAMDFLEGLGRRKALQRRLYQHGKVSPVNSITIQSSYDIHLHVLFTAIEQGHVDRVRAILESAEIEINSLNADGLSTLDVAVLNSNRLLAKMLITYGAHEGNQFKSSEGLKSHLALLLEEAERRLQELGGTVILLEPSSSHPHRGSFSSQHSNLTGCGGSAEEKQLASWERRARTLKKMLMIFEQTGLPDVPQLVTVDVTGTRCVSVKFHESQQHDESSAICTKFKLQWSFSEDFSDVCGEEIVLDMKLKECRVDRLVQGRKYYFRAAAGNVKGYSQFKRTSPPCIIPSSWRDVDGRTARFDGRLEQLDSLFCEVRGPEFCQEGPALQRRNHKKKTATIKQLFTASSKFQKNLRRGVFLSCVLYHEDKILVTNEDFLPVIEMDETYPSLIHQDFYWLMKVACCSWDDVKSLKQDMEKSQSGSTNHFRIKMLQAATQMQTALCIQDLGRLYHKPLRDVQGTLVFSSVNHVRSSKLVSMLNSKWLPLGKITKKLSVHEESNVADILMASIQDQVRYHQASGVKLTRGLYLGYFKLQSSVDSIQVVVPAKSPNLLPHCKVRDNPHVSADEWQCLRGLGQEREGAGEAETSPEQRNAFVEALAGAAKRLFGQMEVGAEEVPSHRVYSAEVLELSPEVSLLVVVPPFESACSPPGSSREMLLKRGDFLSLPIQVFEMIHFGAYQREVSSRYFRLSCILELDTAQAQHSHREAFSASELSLAKERLERLNESQSRMNAAWKAARWLIDLITFARDKTSAGVCVKHLASLDRGQSRAGQKENLKRSLLQLPPRDPKLVKASPGRGSWPGPSAAADSTYSSDLHLLSAELLSKSEQQLPMSEFASYSRKGSGASQCSSASSKSAGCQQRAHPTGQSAGKAQQSPCASSSNSRLPPSKSEDTLALGKYSGQHAERSAASASATSSPLLSLKPIRASASNATSESIQSMSSSGDEWPPLPSCVSAAAAAKAKPVQASVAAIAEQRKRNPQDKEQQQQQHSEEHQENSVPVLLPGILQVYAAYETGLASGTSLKLHVTPRTSAREVVDLVVKQLNMAVVLKGLEGPVYSADELSNFCLVAVIGARERCLRDDFKPLQLQNPWKKGRLYVRQKQDVLAALEHSSKHSAYL